MNDKTWILDELQKGRELSNRDILIERGCMNGKARIAELRKDGHDIQTTMRPGKRKNGDSCRYAVYSMGTDAR